jgi:KDO2-lipid IV(A) lauroyltransferase
VAVYFTRRLYGHFAVVRPPVPTERRGKLRDDVARVTQFLAQELEYLIRRAPEQWHLFQPNWPSDPGYERNPS